MNNKKGNIPAVLLITLVVVLTAAITYLYFQNRQFQQIKTTTVPPKTQTSVPIPQKTSISEIKFETLPNYSSTTANWKTYTIASEKNLTFKLPSGWTDLKFWNPMPPNAYGVQSPEFQSKQGFRYVSSGSSIYVAVGPKGNWLIDIDEAAKNEGQGTSVITHHFKIAGYDAAEYTHNSGENHNNVNGIVILAGDKKYLINQYYPIGQSNPYPTVVQEVASTISIK